MFCERHQHALLPVQGKLRWSSLQHAVSDHKRQQLDMCSFLSLATCCSQTWWVSRLQRWTSESLAMTSPVAGAGPACSASSSWNVLLPGAAHMSSTCVGNQTLLAGSHLMHY